MVRSIPHPTLGTVCLGRRHSTGTPPARFADFIPKKLPGVPLVLDLTPKAMPALDLIYLNYTLGDCLPAGNQHLAGVWTGNASGAPTMFTDAQTDANYTGMSGGEFNPSDPSTDQGCEPLVAIEWWRTNGLLPDGSHKIAGYLSLDPNNRVQLRSAIWLFGGGVGFALDLPDPYINPAPAASGFTWDVAGEPDPENGHWIVSAGYNAKGVTIATWGMLGTFTYEALGDYCPLSAGGELYAMISQDALNAAMAKAPNGLDWAQMKTYFDGAGGNA